MVNQYVEHLLSIIMQKKLKKKMVWEKIKNIYFYVKSKFIQKCLKIKNFDAYMITKRYAFDCEQKKKYLPFTVK